MRLRTDDQLVALFRMGYDEAFQAIFDRYRQRLLAYTRQMLGGSRSDAEDALQDVFLRAYSALRCDERPVTLRAWLYRVAHNRCVDQLRRPVPAPADVLDLSRAPLHDPTTVCERREELRRLVADVGRLPDQQRSALLMREMEGLSYQELADALGVTLPAVKSLLVRARLGLVEAGEARDTACAEIRHDLLAARDRGVRCDGRARRHLRDCHACRDYHTALRAPGAQLAGLVPAAAGGPLATLAKLLGLGSAGSGAAAGAGAASAGGGGVVAGGVAAGTATKLAAVICCAAVVGGGAAEVHRELVAPAAPRADAVKRHARAPATPATTVAAHAVTVPARTHAVRDRDVRVHARARRRAAPHRAARHDKPAAAATAHHATRPHHAAATAMPELTAPPPPEALADAPKPRAQAADTAARERQTGGVAAPDETAPDAPATTPDAATPTDGGATPAPATPAPTTSTTTTSTTTTTTTTTPQPAASPPAGRDAAAAIAQPAATTSAPATAAPVTGATPDASASGASASVPG